jgi:hypothetical protein
MLFVMMEVLTRPKNENLKMRTQAYGINEPDDYIDPENMLEFEDDRPFYRKIFAVVLFGYIIVVMYVI